MRHMAGLLILLTPAFAQEFTSYAGDGSPYRTAAMTTDSAGNTYLTGERLLTVPGLQGERIPDVFVAKFDRTGKLIFDVTFGGKDADQPAAIAVDPQGNVYVGGTTTSPDYPRSRALVYFPPALPAGFITKLSPDASVILYSTYFYGSVAALATDAAGNLYVAGSAAPCSFPTTPGLPPLPSSCSIEYFASAFVSEIAADGGKILYSGLIGGPDVPCVQAPGLGCTQAGYSSAVAIAVDAAGNAYVAGNTSAKDLLATPGAFAPEGVGAFVAKIKPGGAGLAYLTYLQPLRQLASGITPPTTTVNSVAIDASGNAYVVGATVDPNFPATPGAIQTTFGGAPPGFVSLSTPPSDAFLAKLNPAGTSIEWATYLGGDEADSAALVAVDPSGDVWATGTTASASFPNANGWSQGGDFLIETNPSGSALLYAGRYPDGTIHAGVALESTPGLVHTAGAGGLVSLLAPAQPPTMRVFGIQSLAGGAIEGLITAAEAISIFGPHIGPTVLARATTDSSGQLPISLAGVTVSIGGVEAPLLYVSDSRIDAIVPYASGNTAPVRIVNGAASSPVFAAVQGASPEIFSNPDGSAAALNEDGTLNTRDNPAALGSIVSIWATGIGSGIQVAEVAASANDFCMVACTIGIYQQGNFSLGPVTSFANVVYAGDAPGEPAGIAQINFEIPPNTIGSIEFSLGEGNQYSDPVLVWVR